MTHSHTRGYVLAIGAGMLWGVSGTFAQFLFDFRGLNAEWLVSARLLIAGSLLLLSAVARKDPSVTAVWRNRRDVLSLLLFSILGMLAVQYTFFLTIRLTNAATATIIQFLGPVLIAVYLALKNRSMPGTRQLLAIALAVTGTFLLVTHGSFSSISISAAGLSWGLLSAVALAFYSLQPAGLIKKYTTSVIIGYGMLIGGIAMSFLSHPWTIPGRWDTATFLCTGFIIVLATLVAFHIYMTSVKLIGPQTPSLLVSVEPASAALLAVWWLKVPFGVSDAIGTVCILLTVFLLTHKKKEPRVQ